MMQKMIANKAAYMSPLLLRPLLADDCEIKNDFNMGGDNSLQLMLAAAANHAQAIVITLLDEYDKNKNFGVRETNDL